MSIIRSSLLMGAGGGGVPLIDVIQAVGLTTDLEVVLDAGDSASYGGSGQSWLDRSGNGFDFFRGATGSPATDDPTFNGTAGRLSDSEYWSFDGGDFFRYDVANEAWMNNLHKNNALFTLMVIVFPNATGTTRGLSGTHASQAANVGFEYLIGATEKVAIDIADGSGTLAMSANADNAMSTGAWHMVAVSIDEAAGVGGGFFYRDGAFDQVSASDTFDATYDTPSAAAATHKMEIGAAGNAALPLLNTERIACFAAWEGRVLTKAQLDSIFARIRGRFGI